MRTNEFVTLLKDRIQTGYADDSGQLPHIHSIAKEFGISPVTAVKGIKALVEDEVLVSIRGKGVFLKQNAVETKRIGLVTMNYGDVNPAYYAMAFSSYLTTASEILKSAGYRIIRLDKADLKGPTESIRQQLEELDAMIITIGCIDNETLPHLLAWNKPIVLIQHEEFTSHPFHQVIPDMASGFRKLGEFLLKNKVRELLVVTDHAPFHEYRIKCLMDFYREHSDNTRITQIEVMRIERISADAGRLTGQLLGEKILAAEKKYDAIFTPSDFLAFGIVDVMKKHGLKCGVDYKLVSYDNLEAGECIPFERPLLTGIDKHPEKISEAAAKLILSLDKLGNQNRFLCEVPCDFVIRESMPMLRRS